MTAGSQPRRIGELRSGRGLGWSVCTPGADDQGLDRARGALLGLVIAEQQRAPSAAVNLTALAQTTLRIAELLADSDDVHPGELARAIIDHALPDERYDEDLLALLAAWQRGIPVQVAASHVNAPDGVASDFAAVVLSPLAIEHAGDPIGLLDAVRGYAGSDAADAVATALFCATTAGAFAGALHKARCATGPLNGVQALTGALAGARFGCGAIPTRLLQVVPPSVHARVLRVAPDMLRSSNATLT